MLIFICIILNLGRTDRRSPWWLVFPEFTSESGEPAQAQIYEAVIQSIFIVGESILPPASTWRDVLLIMILAGRMSIIHPMLISSIMSPMMLWVVHFKQKQETTGSFVGNIAIRTINPKYPMRIRRRPVEHSWRFSRFYFQGDGFWIHGGECVWKQYRSGCSGHGFIYWTEGLREVDTQLMRQSISRWHIPNGLWTSLNQCVVGSCRSSKEIKHTQQTRFGSLLCPFYALEDVSDLTQDTLRGFTRPSRYHHLECWHDGCANRKQRTIYFWWLQIVNDFVPEAIGISTTSTVGNRTIWNDVSVDGFETGMLVPTQGDITIRGGTWSNEVDFLITPPQSEPTRQADNRDVRIDVDFEPLRENLERSYLRWLKKILSSTGAANNERCTSRFSFQIESSWRQPSFEQQVYFWVRANYIPINEDIISSDAMDNI